MKNLISITKKKVLYLNANECDSLKIANNFNISNQTDVFQRKSNADKLGVKNTTGTVRTRFDIAFIKTKRSINIVSMTLIWVFAFFMNPYDTVAQYQNSIQLTYGCSTTDIQDLIIEPSLFCGSYEYIDIISTDIIIATECPNPGVTDIDSIYIQDGFTDKYVVHYGPTNQQNFSIQLTDLDISNGRYIYQQGPVEIPYLVVFDEQSFCTDFPCELDITIEVTYTVANYDCLNAHDLLINYGSECLLYNTALGGYDVQNWHQFTATADELLIELCTDLFSTLFLYEGDCDNTTLIYEGEAEDDFICDGYSLIETISGLTPGRIYYLVIDNNGDGCYSNFCVKMASPCTSDITVDEDVSNIKEYVNYKSITSDIIYVTETGDLTLSATDFIVLKEGSEVDKDGTLLIEIKECEEVQCSDGFDDDNDSLPDCEDPDCQGILPPSSVGGTLFIDENKDGLNEGEAPISFITLNIQLFHEGDDPNVAQVILETTNDPDGHYLFSNLNSGRYFIYIPSPNSEYPSVSPDQVNLDNGVDNDSNGLQSDLNNDNVTDGPITSPVILLCPGSEPTDDGDDDRSDLTIDIGFTTSGCISLTYECDCYDGIDNDGNGVTDCADPTCGQDICCSIECDCEDGIDNDGNGDIDCDDSYCDPMTSYIETCFCNDGIDNDFDQLTDCDDPDCANFIYQYECNCLDGIDNDGDGLIDTLDDDECV